MTTDIPKISKADGPDQIADYRQVSRETATFESHLAADHETAVSWTDQYTSFLKALNPEASYSIGQRAGLVMTTVKAFGAWAHAPMMVADRHTGVGFADALEDTLKLNNLKTSVPELVSKWKELDGAIDILEDLGPASKGLLKVFSKIQVIDAVADAVGVAGSLTQALVTTTEFASQGLTGLDTKPLSAADVASSWVEAFENVSVILATQGVAIKLAPVFYGATTAAFAAIGVSAAPAAAVIGVSAVATIAATMGVDYAITSFSNFVQGQIGGGTPPAWLAGVAGALEDLSEGLAGENGTRSVDLFGRAIEIDLSILNRLSEQLQTYANRSTTAPETGREDVTRSAVIGPNYGSSAIANQNDTLLALAGQSPWDIGWSAIRVRPDGTFDVLNHGNPITAVTEPIYELASKHGTLPIGRRIRTNAEAGETINRTLAGIADRSGIDSPEYSGALERLMNPYKLNFGSRVLAAFTADQGSPSVPDDFAFVRNVFAGAYRELRGPTGTVAPNTISGR